MLKRNKMETIQFYSNLFQKMIKAEVIEKRKRTWVLRTLNPKTYSKIVFKKKMKYDVLKKKFVREYKKVFRVIEPKIIIKKINQLEIKNIKNFKNGKLL